VAGYSGTPLAKKLGVKEGTSLALLSAPDAWQVPGLPDAVRVLRTARGSAEVTVQFVRSAAELATRADGLVARTRATDAVWIAWPRKASGHVSDLTEQLLRDTFLPTGLVDVKVAALDDDWSGLKFVWRKEHR
jgi:hypothetical protein